MLLYCLSCKHNHRFTNGEAERIIYTLQGMEWDAVVSVKDEREYGDYDCLRAILGLSHDSECYAEHTTNLVENRLLNARFRESLNMAT
jgi:hypothetical protein